jgi:hypothetical protein
MVRQAGHSDGFETIMRANRTLLLAVLWAGLFGCVLAASVLAYPVATHSH